MKFGDNLRALRKSSRISQERLAQRVGVSRQSVSKWETGEAYPEMNNIMALCRVFDCEIVDLLNNSISDRLKIAESPNSIDKMIQKDKDGEQNSITRREKFIKISKLVRLLANMASLGWCLIAILLVVMIGVAIFAPEGSIILTTLKNIFLRDGASLMQFMEANFGVNVDLSTGWLLRGLIALAVTGPMVMAAIWAFLYNNVARLFGNFINGTTPFALGNVRLLRKIATLCVAVTVMSIIFGSFANIGAGDSVMVVLVVYALAYIFEYGHYA